MYVLCMCARLLGSKICYMVYVTVYVMVYDTVYFTL